MPVLRRPTLLLACLSLLPAAGAWQSAKVSMDAQGRLTYPADAAGNRIPDFSHAGYRGGGVPLPRVPVVKTIAPAAGDNTARLQATLDEVGALPVQPDGYRGTLQLAPGVYEVSGTLRLTKAGVVLAGAGDGDDPATNTILRRTGTSQNAIIQAGTRNDSFRSELPGTRSQITTSRVPVGSRSFEVDTPGLYRVGDAIVIWHPSTQPWLDAVDRGGVTDDNYWRPGEIDIRYHRYVTALSGNTLTVDAPVFNHLDRSLAPSSVYKYDAAHVLTRLGVEKLQVDIVTKGEFTEEHAEDAITFVGAEDSWIRDCTMKHFWHAGVQFEGSTRCTAERCRALEPHSLVTGSRRYNFSMYHAQLILVQDCFASYARHAFVCNGTSLDSGIVFLNGVTDHALTSSEGHRRWSTGLLYDGIGATNRQTTDILGLYNRGTYGTGHGWAAAHSVAWNCNASTGGRIWIQRPPTAQNYGIGCVGNVTGSGPFAGPAGHIEGTGQAGLEPRSLYLAQLAERLGPAATAPRILAEPVSRQAAAGAVVTLSAATSGAGDLAFQWYRNGVAVPGATAAHLVLDSVGAAEAGDYTLRLSSASGTATSAPATLTVTPPGTARLANLSVRGEARTGASQLIAGFVVRGAARDVLLRAVGPPLGLAPFSLPGVLADPRLELFDAQGASLRSNNDWAVGQDAAALITVMQRVGAFALPAASKDAALFVSLPGGPSTAAATGATGGTGLALVEVYDAGAAADETSRFVNLSARGWVGVGGSVLIAGFVIGGDSPKQVLIRAVGSMLGKAPFNVPGTLANPRLQLVPAGSTAAIAANDDWSQDAATAAALRAAAAKSGAFALPDGSLDAALLATLAPGAYTVLVSGVGDTTGVALAEIYEVDR